MFIIGLDFQDRVGMLCFVCEWVSGLGMWLLSCLHCDLDSRLSVLSVLLSSVWRAQVFSTSGLALTPVLVEAILERLLQWRN